MIRPPSSALLEPCAVAAWLDVDVDWVMHAVARGGLPVLGYRTDGIPLMVAEEIQTWLRRPSLADDET